MNKIKIIFLLAVFSLYTLCNNIFADVTCSLGNRCTSYKTQISCKTVSTCIGYESIMNCSTGSTCIGYKSTMSCDTGATCTSFGPQQFYKIPSCDITAADGGCKHITVPSNNQIANFFKKSKLSPYKCSNADTRAPVNGGVCTFLNTTPGKVEQTLNNLLKVHAYKCQYLSENKLYTECILNIGASVTMLYNTVHSSLNNTKRTRG